MAAAAVLIIALWFAGDKTEINVVVDTIEIHKAKKED